MDGFKKITIRGFPLLRVLNHHPKLKHTHKTLSKNALNCPKWIIQPPYFLSSPLLVSPPSLAPSRGTQWVNTKPVKYVLHGRNKEQNPTPIKFSLKCKLVFFTYFYLYGWTWLFSDFLLLSGLWTKNFFYKMSFNFLNGLGFDFHYQASDQKISVTNVFHFFSGSSKLIFKTGYRII